MDWTFSEVCRHDGESRSKTLLLPPWGCLRLLHSSQALLEVLPEQQHCEDLSSDSSAKS